jgi:hypothetical protein
MTMNIAQLMSRSKRYAWGEQIIFFVGETEQMIKFHKKSADLLLALV